jgi:hypothetical protein
MNFPMDREAKHIRNPDVGSTKAHIEISLAPGTRETNEKAG